MVPRAIKMRSIPKFSFSRTTGHQPRNIAPVPPRFVSLMACGLCETNALYAKVFANPFFSRLKLPKFLCLFLHPVIPSTRKQTLGTS